MQTKAHTSFALVCLVLAPPPPLPRSALEPRVYYAARNRGTTPIHDGYFDVRGVDSPYFLKQLPGHIWAQSAGTRTAFYQNIPTSEFPIDQGSHWKPVANPITWFIGFGAVILLFGKKKLRNEGLRLNGPMLVLIAILSGVLFYISGLYNFVLFDNASDQTYLVSLQNESFEVPARSHVVLYLDSGIYQVQVNERKTSKPLQNTRIRVPPARVQIPPFGCPDCLIFNINRTNTYYLESAFYRAR